MRSTARAQDRLADALQNKTARPRPLMERGTAVNKVRAHRGHIQLGPIILLVPLGLGATLCAR